MNTECPRNQRTAGEEGTAPLPVRVCSSTIPASLLDFLTTFFFYLKIKNNFFLKDKLGVAAHTVIPELRWPRQNEHLKLTWAT